MAVDFMLVTTSISASFHQETPLEEALIFSLNMPSSLKKEIINTNAFFVCSYNNGILVVSIHHLCIFLIEGKLFHYVNYFKNQGNCTRRMWVVWLYSKHRLTWKKNMRECCKCMCEWIHTCIQTHTHIRTWLKTWPYQIPPSSSGSNCASFSIMGERTLKKARQKP